MAERPECTTRKSVLEQVDLILPDEIAIALPGILLVGRIGCASGLRRKVRTGRLCLFSCGPKEGRPLTRGHASGSVIVCLCV